MRGWKFTQKDGTDHYSGTVNYRENIGKDLIHPSPDNESNNACGIGFHLGKILRGAGQYSAPGAVFRCEYSLKDVLGEDKYKVRVSKLKVIEEVPAWKGYGPRGKQAQALIDSLPDYIWFQKVGKPFDKPDWCDVMETVGSGGAAWDAAGGAARGAAWVAAWGAARDAAWDAAWGAARDAARGAAWGAARGAAGDAAGGAAGGAAWGAAGDAAGGAAGGAARGAARGAAGGAAGGAAEIIGGIKDGYFSRLLEVYKAGHWPVSFDGKKLVVF